jgi:uncharacterized cupin superfamily protein
MTEKRIINLDAVALTEGTHNVRFAARWARVGSLIGSTGIGCSVYEVPAGKTSCPFHRHHVVHELFFILQGEGEVRLDENRFPVRPGDVIAAPAGKEAHQIVNNGSQALRFLAFSVESPTDIIEYPDSGKILVEAGMGGDTPGSIELLGRLAAADYYDGED